MSNFAKFVKSNQEQAVAAWVNQLNQVRLDGLLTALQTQGTNLQSALASVDDAIRKIDLEVVFTNRGGQKGMHGFIAEVAEVGVGNARSQVLGEGEIYRWVNNNGPDDLIRNGINIQQKFVAAGGRLGLGAIADHLQKYPDYVTNGGMYQLPADQVELIRRLHAMPSESAKLLSRAGDGPSQRDWERVHEFFAKGSIDIDAIEPSNLKYHEVQRGAYGATLEAEKESLRSTDKARRKDAYRASKPTLSEGAKATAVASAIEGGVAFFLAVVEKRRDGKRLSEFTSDDWAEIVGDTSFGLVKGGVRGVSVYSLTNFTATSGSVASAIVTSAFGIAEQANKLRRGEINELEFIENAEILALESAISALSSLLGQALIPVPVLGAVIGNTVGTVMYKAVSSSLSKREAELIARYVEEQRILDERLASEHQELIDDLVASLTDYLELLERAFSPDVQVAFLGSVELALEMGVASDEILDSDEKVLNYFQN